MGEEELMNAKKEVHMKENRNKELEQWFKGNNNKNESLKQALNYKENEIKLLKGHLSGAQREQSELRHLLQSKNLEIKAINDDIHVLTRENQTLHNELATLLKVKESLEFDVKTSQSKLVEARQHLNIAQLEKRDILHTYKKLCEEKNRLDKGTQELNSIRSNLNEKVQYSDVEIDRLQTRLSTVETELQRKISDYNGMERQVESLSRRLQEIGHRLSNAEKEKNDIKSRYLAMRDNQGSTYSINRELQVKMASVLEEVTVVRARLEDTEREKDGINSALNFERNQREELEKIIEANRSERAMISQEREDLLRINTNLKDENFRLRNNIGTAVTQQSTLNSPAPTTTSHFSNLSNDQSQIPVEQEHRDDLKGNASQNEEQEVEEGKTQDQDDASSLEDFLTTDRRFSTG